jgi:hypothetical protein
MAGDSATILSAERHCGGLRESSGPSFIGGATWYEGGAPGDGIEYRFSPGLLARHNWLTADLLLTGEQMLAMVIRLHEREGGPVFELVFNLLNERAARVRMPLSATTMGTWRFPREGAWLKPRCRGQRVDPARVDRVILAIDRMGDAPVRWCMTPLSAAVEQPPRLTAPHMPRGKLLDALGQSTIRVWPAKTHNAKHLAADLNRQVAEAPQQQWPATFGRWGGWRERRLEPTGYFRLHRDRRWWLVDPDGHLFWSAGIDSVSPTIQSAILGIEDALPELPDEQEQPDAFIRREGNLLLNHICLNFSRVFGRDQWRSRWESATHGILKQLGFNTIGNFSDWTMGHQRRYPYVRMVGFRFHQTPRVYRDLPDVFDPSFEREAAEQAQVLAETATDPAMIGYFLMNEPKWGFSDESPAEGMLFTSPHCLARQELASFLRQRYTDDVALSRAWGFEVACAEVAGGRWTRPLTDAARSDLADFSGIMVGRFFGTLSRACRTVDPNHLNLGARFQVVPPPFALPAMKCFDVFSMNCYRDRVLSEVLDHVSRALDAPTIIGEWHFGALDAGLPASGIGRVASQHDRGRAYRFYLETAAADPCCVGVHYFQLYDQSAVGRLDGENYQIGFLDICNRPYEALAHAARASHERLYEVADGQTDPFDDPPAYLPRLF